LCIPFSFAANGTVCDDDSVARLVVADADCHQAVMFAGYLARHGSHSVAPR
jgi:hypothetical protein